MSSPTLTELTTPLTTDEVKTSIYNVLATIGVTTTNWKPGGVVRTMITACAVVLAALSSLFAAFAKSRFIGLAEGSWLTLAAHYDRNVDRIEATFASGEITLINSGGGSYSGTVEGDLEVSNPTTGKAYVNTSAFSVGPLATVVVPIRAVEEGSESSSFAGEITNMVTAFSGVTCSNAAALVGLDAESDEDLTTRCDDKLGALSPDGPLGAYLAVAKEAVRADGSLIGITRLRLVPDGAGGIDMWAATASGGITGAVGDLSTDLGALDDALQTQAVPLAVTLRSNSATPVVVATTAEIWMYNNSGLTQLEIYNLINDALIAYFPKRPIGGDIIGVSPGKIYVSGLEAVIGAVESNGVRLPIFRVEVTLPAADLTLAISEVAQSGAVNVTINQVAPP